MSAHNSPILAPSSPALVGKPIASTGSGSLTIGISLAEPILFLQGFERSEYADHTPTMLRGTLHVHVAKPTKIKAINLSFTGKGRTEWPEGIPPAKDEYYEEKELISHLWPFFNAHFAVESAPFGTDAGVRNPRGAESLLPGAAAAKGYRMFAPGDYTYNFELPIDASLPESIESARGSVRYELEASIERPGAFKSKLLGRKAVTLIRSPAEASLEIGDPIVVSRNWEDQLHYDIVIGGKAFPIGSVVPVAFKLTPLAKVRCHRIRIMITENTEYFARHKKVHGIEPVRKYLLYEHQADGGANENILGNLDDGTETAGPIELEFNAKIPGCNAVAKESQRLHPDTTYGNIKIHHWIKIVLRLSKADAEDPSKRRHFEVSIDSPFHLLSCRCTTANVSLPAYNRLGSLNSGELPPCPCEADVDPAQEAEDLARPMHLLRRPSTNPPPFDADVAPPPMITPPPGYDDAIMAQGGFFGTASLDDEDDDDDDPDRDLLSLGFDELRLDNPARSQVSLTSNSSSASSASS
ncbi:hypothetical protein BZA70DRAFT_259805 [Myxozyma melibiosi]|uniref:Arrestin C-terminal-like domain-containing protein n=1 Tax=Myxozyma melibiosi TaxID=54550 RepID=A0ABR1F0Y4_9ASCO